MLVAVWSVKGGVGTTSVAAMLALAQAERAEPTVAVDLCGDLPLVLGLNDDPAQLGLGDWCSQSTDPDALARIEQQVRHDLQLVACGTTSLPAESDTFCDVARSSQRVLIVDCGVIDEREPATPPAQFRRGVVDAADVSLLVVRECFLNLRAVQRSARTADGVVVIREPKRHLGLADVEAVAHAPVVAHMAFDPAIARSIDAGIAHSRLPRLLLRRLGGVCHAR